MSNSLAAAVCVCLILTDLVTGFHSLQSKLAQPSFLSMSNADPVFVICPGFGNDAKDYMNPLNRGEEFSFVKALEKRGIDAEVVEINRLDWLRLLGPSAIQPVRFAKNEMTPDILYGFYLERVRNKLKELKDRSVVLIGHSAGGWLVRSIVGENDNVLGLVTLGTPHYPAASNDATRGALRYCVEKFPGAFYKKEQGKFYISIGGTAVKADSAAERGEIAYYANNAYLAVTGDEIQDGRVGDGVVPLDFTLLDGSRQLVLDCFHSIQAPGDEWYGGDSVVDKWLPTVSQEIRKLSNKTGGAGVSILDDGIGPWATENLGEGFMKALGLVSVTPYLAFALKAVGVL